MSVPTLTDAASPAIAVAGVYVNIGKACLLHDVTFEVARGDWLSIIGPNGAGKTTLLRALAGRRRSEGSVIVGGADPARLRPRDRAALVAVVAQEPMLPDRMRVADYVLLGRTRFVPMFGVESTTDLDVAGEMLQLVDLAGMGNRPLETLSGGERRRVAIARALAQDPPMLLLDEPTTSLDVGHQQEVLDLVDDLCRTQGLTVISTMNDLTLAGHYSHRLLLLHRGRAVAEGDVADVLTADIVASVYGARVRLIDTPDGPAVVPTRRGHLAPVDPAEQEGS